MKKMLLTVKKIFSKREVLVLLLAAVFLIPLLLFSGCQRIEQEIKHIESATVGLNRKVILYLPNTNREWEGNFNVAVSGSTARFVTEDGKVVIISGTFVIEEIK